MVPGGELHVLLSLFKTPVDESLDTSLPDTFHLKKWKNFCVNRLHASDLILNEAGFLLIALGCS
jgi:hypothetical protein